MLSFDGWLHFLEFVIVLVILGVVFYVAKMTKKIENQAASKFTDPKTKNLKTDVPSNQNPKIL